MHFHRLPPRNKLVLPVVVVQVVMLQVVVHCWQLGVLLGPVAFVLVLVLVLALVHALVHTLVLVSLMA